MDYTPRTEERTARRKGPFQKAPGILSCASLCRLSPISPRSTVFFAQRRVGASALFKLRFPFLMHTHFPSFTAPRLMEHCASNACPGYAQKQPIAWWWVIFSLEQCCGRELKKPAVEMTIPPFPLPRSQHVLTWMRRRTTDV